MPKLEPGGSPDYHEYMRWRVRTDAELKARGLVPLADIAMYTLFQEGYAPKRAADEIYEMEARNGTTEKA